MSITRVNSLRRNPNPRHVKAKNRAQIIKGVHIHTKSKYTKCTLFICIMLYRALIATIESQSIFYSAIFFCHIRLVFVGLSFFPANEFPANRFCN